MTPDSTEKFLYRTDDRLVSREAKEKLLGQRGLVIWLYGLSGAGKTTLGTALEHKLHGEGRLTTLLDGDNIRSGVNRGLTFSIEDRMENIRRVAEVAKLSAQCGIITLCSLITPTKEMRDLARGIIGSDDFLEVFLDCSFSVCASRDVKGLYAKAKSGDVKQFTGKDSQFEAPVTADLVIATETESVEASVETLYQAVCARVTT